MSEFGTPIDIRLGKTPDGTCKGYGFVEFNSEGAVLAALNAKNRTLGGRRITFVPSRGGEADKATLYISNLDFGVTETQLGGLFNDVVSVKIPKDAKGKSKGFAFVEFANQAAANAVLRTQNLVINDRPVTVKRSTKQPAPNPNLSNKDFLKFL